jgi:hypothetical protein
MDNTLSILIDLLPFVVVAVFFVAALADAAIRLRERLEQPRPRRTPQRVHGSHA